MLAAERVHGKFQRQILLGEGLDAEGLKASYENGVLTVNIPVAEKAKPRKINVEVKSSDQKSISAGAAPAGSSAN